MCKKREKRARESGLLSSALLGITDVAVILSLAGGVHSWYSTGCCTDWNLISDTQRSSHEAVRAHCGFDKDLPSSGLHPQPLHEDSLVRVSCACQWRWCGAVGTGTGTLRGALVPSSALSASGIIPLASLMSLGSEAWEALELGSLQGGMCGSVPILAHPPEITCVLSVLCHPRHWLDAKILC